MQKDNSALDTRRRRLQNALLGLFMGDALAMPAHWYYNPDNIAKVFDGGIHGYIDPPHPHLESFMVGMAYTPDLETAKRLGRHYDILHEHARFYRTNYTPLHIRSSERESAHGNAVPQLEDRFHYHHGLKAGENTLAAQLVRVLMRSVIRCGRYDPGEFIQDFIEHMTTPGKNRDPYSEIYIRRCSFCHGLLGDGEGPAAPYMDPRPRDFTLGTFKFRTTQSGELPTNEDLFRTVSRGLPGTAMQAFGGQMNDVDMAAVITYQRNAFGNNMGDMVQPIDVFNYKKG